MVKKLNSMPDFRARLPKQPHDLSRSFAFTSCVGEELPFFVHMCHPRDELFFSASSFTRINPIMLPALAQIDFHIDYFFVPLTVMYTPSNVLHYGTDDLISTLFAGEGADGLKDKFPVLNLNTTFGNWYQNALGLELDDAWYNCVSIPTPSGALTNGFFSCGQASFRLLDMLGYNPYNVFFRPNESIGDRFNPNITPWFLAAYQACHQLYFRNDDREKKDYCYNFDDKFNLSGWSLPWKYDSDSNRLDMGLLTLRYRSRYKDYFNSVKVSPLSSGVSLRTFYDESNQEVTSSQYLQGVRQFLGLQPSPTLDGFGDVSNESGTSLGLNSTNVPFDNYGKNLSTASLRAMFALEKLVRVVGRANKDYESQVLAHFGVKVPHDVMHNITHIGHDIFSLRPEPVVSTASTEDASLGEVGGQGQVSFNGNKFSFSAPCHGVFMAILSSIPRMRYEAGFDKALIFNERLDFWQPEFDRLGMQPLYAYEAIRSATSGTSVRVGWQFGYEHLKRKYDRISMAFHEDNNNSFSPWVLTQRPYIGIKVASESLYPALSNLSYSNFLVQPRDLDKIMIQQCRWGWSEDFVNYPWAMYYTDQFIHDFGFNCKLVNFMSEYGEPELDV